MTIQLAVQTIAAIEKCLTADQGAAYRIALGKIIPHMSDAYRGAEKNPYRMHMGSSGIGKACGRDIWYSFHWATKPTFDGRILRLFNRGHLEEARFLAMLMAISCEVYQQDSNGKQFRISHAGGHFGGSGDGVAIRIPDFPTIPCLLEFKTHNEKSFAKLVKEGVREAKPEHYVQIQTYMRKMGLTVALYGAVNKNNDALHLEIVHLNTLVADQFLDRGQQLVFMREPPKRISESPGWYECKYCDHRPICHLNAEPEMNCRTCFYAKTEQDGTWRCGNPGAENLILSEDQQLAGCSAYLKF